MNRVQASRLPGRAVYNRILVMVNAGSLNTYRTLILLPFKVAFKAGGNKLLWSYQSGGKQESGMVLSSKTRADKARLPCAGKYV